MLLSFSTSVFADSCTSGDWVKGYRTYVWDDGDKKVQSSALKEEKSESILKKQYHWSFSAIRVSVN